MQAQRLNRDSVTPWTPFDFRGYLEGREGKIWRRRDTLKLLNRAEQVDALIVRLLQDAGMEIVERN